MNTIYNEKTNQHSKMIKDLQNLPKVETSENFEFNLMTRIKNKNFGNVKNDKPGFNWIKFLAPSAVAVTAIILIFIFLPSSQQIENPSLFQSQKLGSQSENYNSVAEGKEIINHPATKQNSNSSRAERATQPNIVSKSVSPRIPFNNSRSVSLDDYINGGNNPRNIQRGNIVHSGEESAQLNQFFLTESLDQKTLMKYRAQLDSIKKAQQRTDSLKKVQKMP